MKILLLLSILISILFSSAKLEHITIGNQDFSIVTESYKIYDSKGEVLKFYKEERNNNLTFIFSLILDDSTGTCADKSIQTGSYEINGTNITLYTFWDRKGKAYDSPYGARIQYYEMLPNHTVVLKSSKVYIETARRSYDEQSGMKYLFIPPQTKTEKEAFKTYIKSVEKEYKGTFVYGNEAKRLIEEVHEALRRKMKAKWQSN
jgi:exonuclease III